MANGFQITARLHLVGPDNMRAISSKLNKELGGIKGQLDLNIKPAQINRINEATKKVQALRAQLRGLPKDARQASGAIDGLAHSLSKLQSVNTKLNVNVRQAGQTFKTQAKQVKDLGSEMQRFGAQAALAARRFVAFAIPVGLMYSLTKAISSGVSEALDFQHVTVRIAQVSGKTTDQLKSLNREITSLATTLGSSSKGLQDVSQTFIQAGLSADDTTKALRTLAMTELAPTFDDIRKTTEGAIAVMGQFGTSVDKLESQFGSINLVAAKFAVESDDLVTAIRKSGGAFKMAGGNLNELLALFTSVRSRTRESADSIATAFRTIFARLQRPGTIKKLEDSLNIKLADNGQFVGPIKAIQQLNMALRDLPDGSLIKAAVAEEIGGIRQIGKTIPLINEFSVALDALGVAESGQASLAKDVATAQESINRQIIKVKENFLALFRTIGDSATFKVLTNTLLTTANALIKVADALVPLLPALAILASFKAASVASQFAPAFLSKLAGGKKFAKGGHVPGSGSGDTVPAMLTPGEYVLDKRTVNRVGANNLRKLQKFSHGGMVRGVQYFAGGGDVDPAFKSDPGGTYIRERASNSTVVSSVQQAAAFLKKFAQEIGITTDDLKQMGISIKKMTKEDIEAGRAKTGTTPGAMYKNKQIHVNPGVTSHSNLIHEFGHALDVQMGGGTYASHKSGSYASNVATSHRSYVEDAMLETARQSGMSPAAAGKYLAYGSKPQEVFARSFQVSPSVQRETVAQLGLDQAGYALASPASPSTLALARQHEAALRAGARPKRQAAGYALAAAGALAPANSGIGGGITPGLPVRHFGLAAGGRGIEIADIIRRARMMDTGRAANKIGALNQRSAFAQQISQSVRGYGYGLTSGDSFTDTVLAGLPPSRLGAIPLSGPDLGDPDLNPSRADKRAARRANLKTLNRTQRIQRISDLGRSGTLSTIRRSMLQAQQNDYLQKIGMIPGAAGVGGGSPFASTFTPTGGIAAATGGGGGGGAAAARAVRSRGRMAGYGGLALATGVALSPIGDFAARQAGGNKGAAVLSGAIGGVAAGASVGSLGGPVGMAAGAIVGGSIGIVTALDDLKKAMADQAIEAGFKRISGSLQGLGEALENSGGNIDATVQQRFGQSLADFNAQGGTIRRSQGEKESTLTSLAGDATVHAALNLARSSPGVGSLARYFGADLDEVGKHYDRLKDVNRNRAVNALDVQAGEQLYGTSRNILNSSLKNSRSFLDFKADQTNFAAMNFQARHRTNIKLSSKDGNYTAEEEKKIFAEELAALNKELEARKKAIDAVQLNTNALQSFEKAASAAKVEMDALITSLEGFAGRTESMQNSNSLLMSGIGNGSARVATSRLSSNLSKFDATGFNAAAANVAGLSPVAAGQMGGLMQGKKLSDALRGNNLLRIANQGGDFATNLGQHLHNSGIPMGSAAHSYAMNRLADLQESDPDKLMGFQKGENLDELKDMLMKWADPIREAFEQSGKMIEEHGNQLSDNLAQFASITKMISESQDQTNSIALDRAKFAAGRASSRFGGDMTSYLGPNAQMAPLIAQQQRLTGLGGNAMNPQAILEKAISSQNSAQSARTAFEANPTDMGALSAMRGFETETQNAVSALKNLADASKLNAGLMERMANLDKDREARLSAGENFLNASPQERREMNKDAQAAMHAIQVGNFDAVHPEIAKRASRFMRANQDVKMPGSDRTFGDQLTHMIGTMQGGLFRPQQKDINEAKTIEQKMAANFDTAIQAQTNLTSFLQSTQQTFFSNLATNQQEFLQALGQKITNPGKAFEFKPQVAAAPAMPQMGPVPMNMAAQMGRLPVEEPTNQANPNKKVRTRYVSTQRVSVIIRAKWLRVRLRLRE